VILDIPCTGVLWAFRTVVLGSGSVSSDLRGTGSRTWSRRWRAGGVGVCSCEPRGDSLLRLIYAIDATRH